MATLLLIFSRAFTIRPFAWFWEKVFKKNELKRSIALEFHFFWLALAYTILLIVGIATTDEVLKTVGIVIGIFGNMCVSYEIFMDNAESVDDVSYTVHNGYTASVSGDNVTVSENTKEKLSGATIVALLFSPLNLIVRLVNLIISFKTLSADSQYICLLGHFGHATDNLFKKIFVDTVKISEYTSYHGYSYEGFIYYQQQHGKKDKTASSSNSETSNTNMFDIITMKGSNGNSADMYYLERVSYHGKTYAVLKPVEPSLFNMTDKEVVVCEEHKTSKGNTYDIITDDNIFSAVIDIFKNS